MDKSQEIIDSMSGVAVAEAAALQKEVTKLTNEVDTMKKSWLSPERVNTVGNALSATLISQHKLLRLAEKREVPSLALTAQIKTVYDVSVKVLDALALEQILLMLNKIVGAAKTNGGHLPGCDCDKHDE